MLASANALVSVATVQHWLPIENGRKEGRARRAPRPVKSANASFRNRSKPHVCEGKGRSILRHHCFCCSRTVPPLPNHPYVIEHGIRASFGRASNNSLCHSQIHEHIGLLSSNVPRAVSQEGKGGSNSSCSGSHITHTIKFIAKRTQR